MSDVKIIFFDIDGTMIDMQKKVISEKMLETLRRLQQKEIKICMATGRGPVTLPHFEGVEFDAYLTFNGSYCYSGEKTIFSNPIPKEDVHRIIQNAAGIGRPVSLATKDRLAANGKDQDLIEYYGVIKLGVDTPEDFDAVAESEVYQIMSGGRKEEYDALLKDAAGAKITAWWHRAVDIIPAVGGKGVGVSKILTYFGFDRSQAMAFGDGNNDIEMLEAVGCGVAMENASPELKAVADEICGHVADDGIYHYCRRRGLI